MKAPASVPERSGVDERDFFLPDFCAASAVLAIVLIAALLGFVLVLARQTFGSGFWFNLARTSAFLLWAGLLCAAVLCRGRPWLATKPLWTAVTWSLVLIVGTVAALSATVCVFGRYWSMRLGVPDSILPNPHWQFVLTNMLIAGVIGALALRYFYVTQQWRRSVQLEARARILALQARIRPHFLFNSMNTIASLTRTNPVQAEAAIEDLSDLFRVSLSDARAQISLEEEVEIARTYQRIEQLRLGDRLQVHWDLGDVPSHSIVPSLLLQPLLENAIRHGIEPLPDGGIVCVRGRLDHGAMLLEVTNPKPSGTPPTPHRGHRMALDNIRQRLELAFPGRANVDVDDADSHFSIRLRFPHHLDESVGLADAQAGSSARPS